MKKRWTAVLVTAAGVGSLLWPAPGASAKERILRGPELERADPGFAIVRWASTTPGGSPLHFGVVHYGTDPGDLGHTAQSPVRLNPGHRETVFRVRIDGLRSKTTYYYRVDSRDADGRDDGLESPVRHFTTS
jgi:hypothetical protein